MLNQRRMGLSCSLMDALFVYSGAGFAWGAACILWADTVTCQRKQSWFGVAVRTVLRRCFPKIKLDPFCLVSVTHNLTHNRKRAGGGNGAESTVSSDFSEQKGPKSVRRRCFEGRQSVGKDEVPSSNLGSSSRKSSFSCGKGWIFLVFQHFSR